MTNTHKTLRIGVDVGGTNTDAVILDLTSGAPTPVLASFKSPTTKDVTHGIQSAVRATLEKANIDKSKIQAIAIGTTSFVNSLIERNTDKLDRVAVIRLCGPYSKLSPPFAGFPYELRHVLEGPAFLVQGGIQVDGKEISQIDMNEIRGACAEIRKQGIRAVAISAVYAPIDFTAKHEEVVRAIVQQECPGIKISIGKEVANIGLLERENATILNASLLSYASQVVAGFVDSVHQLQLDCPLFLTSNDGTLMSCDQAVNFPIKTFSSGPTNSMRGANFLASWASGGPRRETALVVDVGGTTTEVGVLLPTGFPRQAAAQHQLCGVRLNFSMPHVHSIGLGGGSRIRKDSNGRTTVGPDSVGYNIHDSISFGGQTTTATDIVVASGRVLGVGNPDLVKDINEDEIEAVQRRIKVMIELVLDEMKTSTDDVPVYLVGGGAILVPDTLNGVSKVHRFPFYDAANAVGAACAQVSGVIDTFEDISIDGMSIVRQKVEQRAIDKAIAAGADPLTTVVVESEAIPIAYTTGRCRFYVKAAGDWTGSATQPDIQSPSVPDLPQPTQKTHISNPIKPVNQKLSLPEKDEEWTATSLLAYKPTITQSREWILSELDIEWMSTGCYILGCGGGGNPLHVFLALRNIIREGHTVKVVDLENMDEKGSCLWGGGIGSPEVSMERLIGEEYMQACRELIEFLRADNVTHLSALEIGGANGLINLIAGSTKYLDLPIIDGDFMGRAYPTGWQCTPNVFDTRDRAEMMLPVVMCSGDGSSVFMTKVKHYLDLDSILRAACVEMGTHAGAASRPLSRLECEKSMVKNTLSQAWRIGRSVALANKTSNISQIGNVLMEAVGKGAVKVLFSGKVVEVNRKLVKGHTVGEIVVKAVEGEEGGEGFEGVVTVPFKNENLYVEHDSNGVKKVICGVPDLIAVLDAQSGQALGTPDYKYGLRVLVIALTAAPQWTSTQRGLDLGSLKAFGYDIPYEPVGGYVKPRSVIEEYGPMA